MKTYKKPTFKVYTVKTSSILAGSGEVDQTTVCNGYGPSQSAKGNNDDDWE